MLGMPAGTSVGAWPPRTSGAGAAYAYLAVKERGRRRTVEAKQMEKREEGREGGDDAEKAGPPAKADGELRIRLGRWWISLRRAEVDPYSGRRAVFRDGRWEHDYIDEEEAREEAREDRRAERRWRRLTPWQRLWGMAGAFLLLSPFIVAWVIGMFGASFLPWDEDRLGRVSAAIFLGGFVLWILIIVFLPLLFPRKRKRKPKRA